MNILLSRTRPSTSLVVGALLNNDVKSAAIMSNRLLRTTTFRPSEDTQDKPVKFTTSDAHLNYRASQHFYNEPRTDIPKSHNYVLASTAMFAIYYLIFIREDPDDNEGALNLAKPIYEIHPKFAIPMIESMITDYRRYGRSTKELQEKLAFYMQDPEKYGGKKQITTLKEK